MRARLLRVLQAVRRVEFELEPDLLALLDETAAPAVGECVDEEETPAVLAVGVGCGGMALSDCRCEGRGRCRCSSATSQRRVPTPSDTVSR
ncbi:hypothetical protein OH768_49435 [Streptomyces sp. NBC_01622]|uniref:hypothetical protein n=1 Tax=Streptomyces sp. NBC_01622 TaxID=2975903 RepID=UPI00386DE724|nr:hypothetical protein OH768_49435 [Streptomyces sp. NBC_01622]